MKCYKFEHILKDLYQKNPLTVVEKLAGNNPKSSSLFFKSFGSRLYYQAINLIEQTETYDERASNYAQILRFSIKQFKKSVKYVGGVNIVNTKLSSIVNETDVIIYWGGAMNCIRTFEGESENTYKKIVEDEYSMKDGRHYLEINSAIRRRMRKEIPQTKKILGFQQLEEIIIDDLSCLTENGIFITNAKYDFYTIKGIMEGKGFKWNDYLLEDLGVGLQPYETKITVWKKW
jgi:hypothetical protein